MKTSKIKFKLLFSALLILAVPQFVSADFSDVPSTHQQFNAITALEDQGVIKGYSDGTFRPEEDITRAALLKTVFASMGYTAIEGFYDTNFEDVDRGSWFAPYVDKAYELGVIKFEPDNPRFFPSNPILNLEAIKIIMPLFGIPVPFIDVDTTIIYRDVPQDASYSYIIKAAQNAGIHLTKNRFNYRPFSKLSRGDAAELLFKAQIFRLANSITSLPPELFDQNLSLGTPQMDLIDNPKFPIFVSVWNKINDDFLERDDLDPNDLIYGAISGMVDSLQDQYSKFEEPEAALATKQNLELQYEGIGIVLDSYQSDFIVLFVMEDSPAQDAGLLSGDIITHVNGENIRGLTIQEVVSKIKGPANTSVKLTILRNGSTFNFNVLRQKIKYDTVIFEEASNVLEIPDDIGYIAIAQFTNTTDFEFAEILKQTINDNTKGLILDLRNNPGGYVDTAYGVLDHFVPENEKIANFRFGTRIVPEFSRGEGELANLPIVVLVNDNTASAAEIVAIALQDHNIGTILGEQTFGKGTVQELTIYVDGSLFKMSIAEWLSPFERNINHIGLTPDIIVSTTKEDILGLTDSQLARAILELQ